MYYITIPVSPVCRFLHQFPHPATLAGMLHMSTVFLPTSDCWQQFQNEAEGAYRSLEREMMTELGRECREAVMEVMDHSWRRDPWLWDLEWGLASRKTIKGRLMDQIHGEDSHLQQLFTVGFPAWYQDLAALDHDGQPFLNLSTRYLDCTLV